MALPQYRYNLLLFLIADITSIEEDWIVNVTLDIRSSTGTGVMFALVKEDTVPLAVAIEDQSSDIVQVCLQFFFYIYYTVIITAVASVLF